MLAPRLKRRERCCSTDEMCMGKTRIEALPKPFGTRVRAYEHSINLVGPQRCERLGDVFLGIFAAPQRGPLPRSIEAIGTHLHAPLPQILLRGPSPDGDARCAPDR